MHNGIAPEIAPIAVLTSDLRLSGVYNTTYTAHVPTAQAAASRDAKTVKQATPDTKETAAKDNTSRDDIRPEGNGRFDVRTIRRSENRSSH
jgi:hypothetical protein